MNSTIYKQYDSRWGSKPYPGRGYTLGGSGCGCLACTHVAMEQSSKAKWTPEKLRPWMIKQGFAICGNGTTWDGIRRTLLHVGHKSVVHIDRNDPMSKAFKELNKGNRIGVILFLSDRTPNGTVWTGGGHYVAFTDYYVGKDGRHYFYTKDSGGRDHSGWYSYERSMKGAISQMWIVERISEKKTSKKKSTYKGSYPSTLISKKYGSTQNILHWQEFLNWWKGGLTEDGIFGSGTEKVTKQFQKAYGLVVDGVVGPVTINKAKEVGSEELH